MQPWPSRLPRFPAHPPALFSVLLPLALLLLAAAFPAPSQPVSGPPTAEAAVPAAAPLVPALATAWPVGTRPRVTRGWEPPASAYGPGHRGVDLATAAGAPVRAVAAGRVSFAGRVAGRGVVSVALAGTALRTTYEPVTGTVRAGDEVAAGDRVGTVEATGGHCVTPCLHWGLLSGETYLDPLSLLPPWLRSTGPSRLLPLTEPPPGRGTGHLR
ncbi:MULTISPECIES: M23 family metallopeptidase [Streptomyces]|uniref:M23 family metallopeptidase n=1 Tax=Streptomyces TaxID=1883 RepID=UPI00081AFE6A|nr:Peptidase family M23 [Streptomyces sp. SolWspMP-5a-2]